MHESQCHWLIALYKFHILILHCIGKVNALRRQSTTMTMFSSLHCVLRNLPKQGAYSCLVQFDNWFYNLIYKIAYEDAQDQQPKQLPKVHAVNRNPLKHDVTYHRILTNLKMSRAVLSIKVAHKCLLLDWKFWNYPLTQRYCDGNLTRSIHRVNAH